MHHYKETLNVNKTGGQIDKIDKGTEYISCTVNANSLKIAQRKTQLRRRVHNSEEYASYQFFSGSEVGS